MSTDWVKHAIDHKQPMQPAKGEDTQYEDSDKTSKGIPIDTDQLR